ncbi:MAG: VanZ family protein [Candidatus Acidiferrales bacterium]
MSSGGKSAPERNAPDSAPPEGKNWITRWWPALVWAALISCFSTSAFTDEKTSSVIVPILHWLLPRASHNTLLAVHHVIRKAAHFVEYFIFSLLILRAIRAGRRDTRLVWALAAILIVAGYACFDEFHQSFVPGRTSRISDVLLDTTGGTAAQAIAGLVLLWGHVRERQKRFDPNASA